MRLHFAFFGSSLVSAYWNGAATYYRGIVRGLAARGHNVTFYEPDAFERQQHRDLADPPWARVVVYEPTEPALARVLREARTADVIVKCSGIGVFDEQLERAVLELRAPGKRILYWDIDAPATLDRVQADTSDRFRPLVREYDFIFTDGGGPPVVTAYQRLGAQQCVPIYNALDPDVHLPVAPERRFECDLAFLGNRLPDREARVQEFFFSAAQALPDRQFLLAGNGWDDVALPPNVKSLGHVYTAQHNALNSTALAVLNLNGDSVARYGFSPATRVFEAAGAAACIITDDFNGVEMFLSPDKEILIAESGDDVARILERLTPDRARRIGQAARTHVLDAHSYAHRVRLVESILYGDAEEVSAAR
jgi:spore maturation protein CgeB